jgi:acyl-CoA reductase-like NAD-dependent aldehyde dehydrogenase
MHHGELLIDGYWMGGPCDTSFSKDAIRSPWDNHVVGYVAEGQWEHLDYALAAATAALNERRGGNQVARADLLVRIADAIRSDADYLAELMVAEIGKPIRYARAEVARAEITFRLAAEAVPSDDLERVDLSLDPRNTEFEAWRTSVPLGVLLAFVPYNWPINLAAHKLAPAIAAGCPIVLKLSPKAPLSSLALVRLIHSAGAAPGTVQAWHGNNGDAARAVSDPRVAMVSFTGSMQAGWELKKLARREVTLELGGMAPAIIFPDADLDLAIPAITDSAFGYAGQVCISTQQVWIHEDRWDETRERLAEAAQTCPTGDPTVEETICGPVIDAQAANRLSDWLAEVGVAAQREGNLIHPIIVEEPSPTSRLATEEVFGPVLTLHRWKDREDLKSAFRRSPYGIHAGVFAASTEATNWAFAELPFPGVVVNGPPSVRFDALPYGGDRESGIGREGIPYAIDRLRTYRSKCVRTKKT